MDAKYPRFIITVNGEQAAMAWSHDEAWMRAMALWRRGCVVRCEPTEVIVEGEAGEADAGPGHSAE